MATPLNVYNDDLKGLICLVSITWGALFYSLWELTPSWGGIGLLLISRNLFLQVLLHLSLVPALAPDWLKETTMLVLIFCSIDIAITWLGVILVPPTEAQGVLRPISAIPLKVLLLLMLGLSLGASASFATRQFNPSLIVSGGALTLLLDLDHIPSMFNIPQPIRPAHSIIFLIAVSALVYLTTRRASLTVLTCSTFFAHLGSDKAFFPLLSPFIFDITEFGPEVSYSLILVAFVLAYVAGLLKRRQNNLKADVVESH